MIDLTSWLRPASLEISGPFLRWRTYEEPLDDDPDEKWTNLKDGLLGQFVRLRDDEDGERILSFASSWGVLGLCEHQLPLNHHEVPSGVVLRQVLSPDQEDDRPAVSSQTEDDPWGVGKPKPTFACPPVSSDGWLIESLDSWRRMATVFTSISRAAEDEWSQKPPNRDVWNAIHPRLGVDASAGYRGAVRGGRRLDGSAAPATSLPPINEQMSQRARAFLGALVDDLMRLGGVRLGFDWTDLLPEVNLEAEGLFGAIAIELALAVSRASGFAICSECNDVYTPSRRPVEGKRSYCQSCKETGAPIRNAQRDKRQRDRIASSSG